MTISIHENLDELYWKKLIEGDREAFSLLYNKYFDLLYDYGMRLFYKSETVEDCIQDLFLKIWRNKRNLPAQPAIKSYLFSALRNRVINRLYQNESRIRRESLSLRTNNFHIQYSVEDQIIEDERDVMLFDWITETMELLTPKQKECIYLRFYSGLEYEEIASILNISVKAVYKLKNRGILSLRTRLNKAAIFSFIGPLFYIFTHLFK